MIVDTILGWNVPHQFLMSCKTHSEQCSASQGTNNSYVLKPRPWCCLHW